MLFRSNSVVVTPSAPAGSPMSQAMSTPTGPSGGQSNQPQQSQQNQQQQPQQANNQPSGGGKKEETKEQKSDKQKEAVAANKNAKSMDEQKAAQNTMIAAMSSVPGFDNYAKVRMFDSLTYRPFSIYGGQTTVDNRRASRGLFGASDSRHDEMVQSQYR